MDSYTWSYFDRIYDHIHNTFKRDVNRLRIEGDSCFNEVISEWYNPYREGDDQNKPPILMHTRNYMLGSEVWGLIHDTYGKKKVYWLLNNLNEFSSYYNKALKMIGYDKYMI